MSEVYRVGLARELLGMLRPAGELEPAELGLDLLEGHDGLEVAYLDNAANELSADDIAGYDAVLALANLSAMPTETIVGAERLLHVARFGVGYDNVDVEACTRTGVAVTIAPDGVRRAMAGGALTFILALSRNVATMERLAREGRWAERFANRGLGLTGRTLGVVGLGNIGRDLLTLATPFEMRHLAYDPYAQADVAVASKAELVGLEELLAESDFVVIACQLTDETHHLIDAARLAAMKPSAYLINVARGPIVDQSALVEALRERQIAGAGLDVFEKEPLDPDDPILALDNVIATPHAIGTTDESLREIGRSACRSVIDIACGRIPPHVVNRDVLDAPRFRERLAARARAAG